MGALSVRREKDKSSKRKSNLNRSLAAEEVPALADPSDDAAGRRRRRRQEQAAVEAAAAAVVAARRADRPSVTADDCGAAPTPTQASPSPSPSPRAPRAPPSTERASPARKLPSVVGVTPRPKASVTSSSTSSSPLSGAFLSATAASPVSESSNAANRASASRAPSDSAAGPAAPSCSPSARDGARRRSSPGLPNHEPSGPTPAIVSPVESDAPTAATPAAASPSRQPFSILKRKSLEEAAHPTPPPPTPPPPIPPVAPVSILKRKTSQDEAGAPPPTPPPPVTFSPSVKDADCSAGGGGGSAFSRRQGILKKRASLDEAVVLRQRSCSPDTSGLDGAAPGPDFRPILKAQQRRSSLEELVRRARSPDGPPHSILKRRSRDSGGGRDSDADGDDRATSSPEPQGILKRKTSGGSVCTTAAVGAANTDPLAHASITPAVIKTVTLSESELFPYENGEHVRPILKKKSSSEDNAVDVIATETPRPILKKKASVETEDEDRPKKPILKTARKHSYEENGSLGRDSPTRCLRLGHRSDSASGSDCEVRPILKNASDGLRSSRDRSASPRPRLSFCGDDPALPGCSSAGGSPTRNVSPRAASPARRAASPVTLRRASRSPQPVGSSEAPRRPLSVAERVLNMESFLEQEAAAARSSPTGAVPKRLGNLRASRNKERFHTQPITQEELLASARYNHVLSPVEVEIHHKSQINGCDHETENLEGSSGLSQRLTGISPPPRTDRIETKLEAVSPVQDTVNSFKRNTAAEDVDLSIARERVGSVSARASLFAKLEEEMKQAAQEAKLPKIRDGSAVSRYRARREQISNSQRFSTQPVTQEEVQEAWRQKEQNESSTPSSLEETPEDVQDEDDPSKLSLAERVKLFNQKIKDGQLAKPVETLAPPTRRRVHRFQTQPVTTEEVETAQLISPLAASLVKPPDPKLLGTMSARAAREKMMEHGTQILSRSNSLSHQHSYSETEQRLKGILKPPREGGDVCRRSLDREDSETEAEVRGILKPASPAPAPTSPELESFRRLRSVLKKESAAGDTPHSILKSSASSGAASSGSDSEDAEVGLGAS